MLTPRIIYIHFLCDTKQLYVYYENIVILIPILLKIWGFFQHLSGGRSHEAQTQRRQRNGIWTHTKYLLTD